MGRLRCLVTLVTLVGFGTLRFRSQDASWAVLQCWHIGRFPLGRKRTQQDTNDCALGAIYISSCLETSTQG